jgi:hypothetical protein
MDQRMIMTYLSLKKMTVCQIHNGLVRTLGIQTISIPTVIRFLRANSLGCLSPVDPHDDKETERKEIDSAILATLDDLPF